MDRQLLTQNLKLLWATYYFAFRSKDPKDIAGAVHVKPRKLHQWMKTDEWIECLSFWGQKTKTGDFNIAERRWTEMIENHEHLSPVDYPDIPENLSRSQETLEVYALIESHLFCVDNLCDEQIRARLAEEREFEGEPVRYEEQTLENPYHWWIYPNFNDGIYSKVLARVNAAGDLVVGSGDDTSLVIIRHGRLTLTRQVSDDVANVSDERLLVCL